VCSVGGGTQSGAEISTKYVDRSGHGGGHSVVNRKGQSRTRTPAALLEVVNLDARNGLPVRPKPPITNTRSPSDVAVTSVRSDGASGSLYHGRSAREGASASRRELGSPVHATTAAWPRSAQ
jgi:hypothetical protein